MKIKIEKSERKPRQKKSSEVIFFYVMTFVFGICFCFSVYNVTTYIGELVSAGSLTVSSSIKDIIVYYINNCGSMLAYTVFAFGFACILKKHAKPAAEEVVEEEHVLEEAQEPQQQTSEEPSQTEEETPQTTEENNETVA